MRSLKCRVRSGKIAELRELAVWALAETRRPGYFGARGPSEWAEGVGGGLGGPAGQYCAAVHPELLVALLDELERLRGGVSS